ncbi:MAG: hypothetical protein NT033_09435, partial [Candidatus Omnitrophica bacterium]|nr:hypothetical protein [Candidatus Omnitrophota bacterium]
EKGKLTAILAAFLLCVSPVHIWYSREATSYSMTLLLLLIASFSFYELKRDDSNSPWYLVYFSSLLLTVFSHWFSLIYLFVFSLLCVFKTKRDRGNILILNSLIFLCMVVFLIIKWKVSPTLFSRLTLLRPFGFTDLWTLLFNWFIFGNCIWTISPYGIHLGAILQRPGLFLAQIFFLFIFVHGVMVIFREERNLSGAGTLLCLFSLPLFILALSLIGYKHVYIERYMFVVLPFFYIVLARGLTGFKNNALKLILIAAILIFAAATLKGFFTKDEEWTVYKHNPDWRSVGNYLLNEQEGVGKPISILVVSATETLVYYQRQFSAGKKPYLDIKLINYNSERETAYKIMQNKESRVFYLIHNNPRNRLLCSQDFKGIAIYKFEVI